MHLSKKPSQESVEDILLSDFRNTLWVFVLNIIVAQLVISAA